MTPRSFDHLEDAVVRPGDVHVHANVMLEMPRSSAIALLEPPGAASSAAR
jgi:hypothetical protein